MTNPEELKIDNEFASLITPLTEDEYSRLEESIIAEGCREPIITWNSTIVDGHNRYKICTANSIAFQTVQKDFASRDKVMLWMIQNQLGRRNLNDFNRIELVRKYEGIIKSQAEQRMLAGKADPKVNLPEGQKSRKQSRDELGKLAGVSGSTYEHAVKVMDKSPASIVEATRNKEISINVAYETTKFPEAQQHEIAERIEHGESAKSVISDIKSRNLNLKSQSETPTKTDDEVSTKSTPPEILLQNSEVKTVEKQCSDGAISVCFVIKSIGLCGLSLPVFKSTVPSGVLSW